MNWIDRLEYKFRRFGIDNLMLYITATMLAVYFADNLLPVSITGLISLNRVLLYSGQIWRLITFVFVPPGGMIFWVLIALYFYYLIGSSLENTWGSTRFTLYYLFGVLGAIIAALISGRGNNMYLNLSLFLAFAVLYPDHQILLFFILPIKVKYIAYVNAAFLLYSFIVSDWAARAAIIASLINFLLFFGGDFIQRLRDYKQYGAQRRNYRNALKRNRDIYGR